MRKRLLAILCVLTICCTSINVHLLAADTEFSGISTEAVTDTENTESTEKVLDTENTESTEKVPDTEKTEDTEKVSDTEKTESTEEAAGTEKTESTEKAADTEKTDKPEGAKKAAVFKSTEEETEETETKELAAGMDDPQSGISMCNQDTVVSYGLRSGFQKSEYTGQTYLHNDRFDGHTVVNGIDVSYHNGGIDWNKVKAAGIEYAMIRVGYRGYTSGTLNEDVNFRSNIQGALTAGLKVGVYIFSQAINNAEAVEEANFIMDRISGYGITLPVVIDFEYASGNTGRLYNAKLSVDEATGVCGTFGNTVAARGYTPMIYANKSMLQSNLHADVLSRYFKIWLANYTTVTNYGGDYYAWQYSSKGRINGISGYVDCNFFYEDNVFYNTSYYNGVDYSAVYNYDYYISKYSDMKDLFVHDPRGAIKHFVENGMSEGRQGTDNFNVYTYKNRYVDLRSGYGKDLKQYYLHYMQNGKKEGRSGAGTSGLIGAVTVYNGTDYSAVYDFNSYISKYSDMNRYYADDDIGALEHFVKSGMQEGRTGNDTFNVWIYQAVNDDLRNGYGNNLPQYYRHYISNGKQENRIANEKVFEAVYSENTYKANYPDLARGYGNNSMAYILHFINHGMAEGRIANKDFNIWLYKVINTDLENGYGNNLEQYYYHYMLHGKNEQRRSSEADIADIYTVSGYKEKNPDLAEVYGNSSLEYTWHFANHGLIEGRRGNEEFNPMFYKDYNVDLHQVFGEDLKQYYMHYLFFGKSEGRKAK